MSKYSHSTKRSNTQEFIEKAKLIHGDKYDYSKVEYVNNHTKVKIHCNRCGNDFMQTPHSHLAGSGCKPCSIELTHEKQRLPIEVFLEKAKSIHKEKYDYSKVEYKSAETPIRIICKRCNKEFTQKPVHHLRGNGCPYCCFERQKENNLKKYGVENVFSLEEIKCKIKQTCLKRYGVEYIQQYQGFIDKVNDTRLKNKTFNTSKDEKEIERLLNKKFPSVKIQYKSKQYPFRCDFYIPSLNLYIEYQGTWTHGKHPFDKTNEEDIERLNIWKNKNTKFYKSAIEVWTIRDPLKRKTAKDNNLNWIEFFTMEEFLNWYKDIP